MLASPGPADRIAQRRAIAIYVARLRYSLILPSLASRMLAVGREAAALLWERRLSWKRAACLAKVPVIIISFTSLSVSRR